MMAPLPSVRDDSSGLWLCSIWGWASDSDAHRPVQSSCSEPWPQQPVRLHSHLRGVTGCAPAAHCSLSWALGPVWSLVSNKNLLNPFTALGQSQPWHVSSAVHSHGLLPWSSTSSCKLLWSLGWCSICNSPQVGENMLERQGLGRMIYARTSAAFLHGATLKRDVGTREWYEQEHFYTLLSVNILAAARCEGSPS